MDGLKKRVVQANSIIIYGAGGVANITYLFLKANGLHGKVTRFVVGKKENNPIQKFGIYVREFDELNESEADSLVLIATQEMIQDEIAEGLKKSNFLNVVKISFDELVSELYQKCYEKPIENNKIVFTNMRGLGYGCNPKYIAQKLLELDREKKLDLVWMVLNDNHDFPQGIRAVSYESLEYYEEMATAHIWIDNMRKNADVMKREGQYYIQTWHGAAPFKRVEGDIEVSLSKPYLRNAKRDSQMADLFLSGSEFYTQLYRKSFWYDGEIMKVGLPRQDVFWCAEGIKSRIYNHFGIEENKLLALYAPTFREKYLPETYDLDIENVRKAIEERFGKEVVFAVSKHPNNMAMKYLIEYNEKCIDVSMYDDFQEILAATDILITDYSGCVYDFSFMEKPVFLYQRDYEQYIVERNFYTPIEELPYISARSNGEMVERILGFDENSYKEKLKKFMDKLKNYDDGHASEKVAEHIWNICFG